MDRDYFLSQQWNGLFYQKVFASIKASLGYGYGPISASVETLRTYNIDPRMKQSLYIGGGNYTTVTKFAFKNTRLDKPKQHYTATAQIGVFSTASKKTKKAINVTAEIPVYLGTTKVSTQTYSLSLPYKSGK
jgi:hypothetical protein